MGDLEKTIKIIFSGIDELSQPINTMSGKLSSFSTIVDTLSSPLAAAADNVLKLDAALAAMVAGGLILAFNKSKDYESAVIELKKILGDTAGVDAAVASSKKLSDQYGQSATDILLSTANFKQAGFEIQDAMTLTKAAMDLVIAGGVSMEQASSLVIATLKGFRLEADSTRSILDGLNAVSNTYATDVEQLATGLAKVSPITSQMGFTFQESMGLLTPIIEVFRDGTEAATALKTGLLKLTDNTKPVADALAKLGVSQTTTNGVMRSGKDIFLDVASALQGMGDAEKLFTIQQLVGIEQSARMSTVFGSMATVMGAATTAMDSAGSMALEVAERLESAQVSVDRFQAGFENLATSIGDQFRLAAQGAVDGGTDIENALKNMVNAGTFDDVFNQINIFSTNLGVYLKEIAKNIPEAFDDLDFDGLLDAMGEVGDSIGGIFEGVDLSSPEGLRDATQKVIDTLESLALVTSGMFDKFKPFLQGIAGFIQSFNEMDEAAKKSSGEILGMGKVVADAGIAIVGAILLIGENADKLSTVFTVVINTIGGAFDVVVVLWNTLKLSFIEILDQMMAASEIFSKYAMFGAFGDDIDATREKLAGWKKDVKTDLLESAESATRNLTGMSVDFSALGDQAKKTSDDIKKIPDELYKIPDQTITEIKAEVGESFTTAATEIEKKIPFQRTTEVDVIPMGVDAVKAEIETIPQTKMMEIQLQGDIDTQIANIKAKADTLQSGFEWNAKLNIANAQADATKIKATFESISESVASVSDATGTMFSSVLENWEKLRGSDQNDFMDLLENQTSQQDKLIESQSKLTDAQTAYINEKTRQMEAGEGLIKISGDGLGPALENVLYEIAELMQVRMLEDQSEFLLTVPS